MPSWGSQGFCTLYYVLTPETTLELWNYLVFMMTNDMIYSKCLLQTLDITIDVSFLAYRLLPLTAYCIYLYGEVLPLPEMNVSETPSSAPPLDFLLLNFHVFSSLSWRLNLPSTSPHQTRILPPSHSPTPPSKPILRLHSTLSAASRLHNQSQSLLTYHVLSHLFIFANVAFPTQ